MTQTIIAVVLLLIALGYVAQRARVAFTSKKGCGGGCQCGNKGTSGEDSKSERLLDIKK